MASLKTLRYRMSQEVSRCRAENKAWKKFRPVKKKKICMDLNSLIERCTGIAEVMGSNPVQA